MKRVEAGKRYEGDSVWVWIPREQIVKRDSSRMGMSYVYIYVYGIGGGGGPPPVLVNKGEISGGNGEGEKGFQINLSSNHPATTLLGNWVCDSATTKPPFPKKNASFKQTNKQENSPT